MGATVGDVIGAEGCGLKTRGCPFAEPLMPRLVRMRAGSRCVRLGGRPGRAQDNIGLVEWASEGCLVSAPGGLLEKYEK